ncbi:hypothetical protein C7974DRAFT_14371 [Boeremia exigua]|uniref:uncharacterized protein n=1 Tax=Boeremia exigua TaxID=749465 RepID=UPI001E8EA94F|nr:uncharacterized protein C7974DRAFT_14371 [Boeremia exigua]KAH6644108.1 hypothetical protein C7974DRAFT_14371 [Boeremia exigua]
MAADDQSQVPSEIVCDSLAKTEPMSSPPPLIADAPKAINHGETNGQQSDADSLRSESMPIVIHYFSHLGTGELQLSFLEYSTLEDRFKKLQRQHSELQDLASAYIEVIGGFSSTGGSMVSIDQLQAEAGREGLRTKAIEADMFRSLVGEAGGLSALMSQTNTMKMLVDNVGGPRELEQFVSDLRTIRDVLCDFKGSQGLVGFASEIGDLLRSKHIYAELQSEVLGPEGLKVRAAKYEKLVQAFNDVQNATSSKRSFAGTDTMNPARARMILSTPLEADPDRDLYEAPLAVTKRNNKTGSNNTPLGASQIQPVLKRKGLDNSAPGIPAKRPQIDLGQASALIRASLPATTNKSTRRDSSQSIVSNSRAVPSALRAGRAMSTSNVLGAGDSRPQVQTTTALLKLPDWMRSDVGFGDVGLTSTPGMPRFSSMPPSQDNYTRSGSVCFSAGIPNKTPSFSMRQPQGMQTVLQATAATRPESRHRLTVREDYLIHEVACWVGASDASVSWEGCGASLKRSVQIPSDLLATFAEELFRHIPTAKHSMYETMAPNQSTCVLR